MKCLGFGEGIFSFITVCKSCPGRAGKEQHREFGALASGLDWDNLFDMDTWARSGTRWPLACSKKEVSS